jgi:hypothetical protein
MTAKEYYINQKKFKYFTKLKSTGISVDFDEIMNFAQAYHEHKLKLLGIAELEKAKERIKQL